MSFLLYLVIIFLVQPRSDAFLRIHVPRGQLISHSYDTQAQPHLAATEEIHKQNENLFLCPKKTDKNDPRTFSLSLDRSIKAATISIPDATPVEMM